MRAVGYCRTLESIKHDDPENSELHEPDRFKSWFTEYCDINFHQAIEHYVDRHRELDEYIRMLEFMEGSASEYLIVIPDARHLGSDLEAVARSLLEIEKTGSSVICMDTEFPDPIQNAFQTLGIKGVSKTRSKRVRESMMRRASQGKALGRPLYGYKIGRAGTLEKVKEEATVVELMYRLYTADNLGFRLVVQHLNARGVTTRQGSPWNVVTVRDVLRNPAYMGTYSRFGIRLPRSHEPIVDAETFKRAQDRMVARRPIGRVSRSEPFLLSRLVVCASCGNNMMGVTRRQKWRRKDGRRASGVYRYYQCQSRQNQGRCDYRTWRASLLETTVLSELKNKMARRIAETKWDADQQALRLGRVRKHRSDRVEASRQRLVSALKRVARGDIPLNLIGDYLEELDVLKRMNSEELHLGLSDALDRLETDPLPSFSELRSIVEENVVRVRVTDDGVTVHI